MATSTPLLHSVSPPRRELAACNKVSGITRRPWLKRDSPPSAMGAWLCLSRALCYHPPCREKFLRLVVGRLNGRFRANHMYSNRIELDGGDCRLIKICLGVIVGINTIQLDFVTCGYSERISDRDGCVRSLANRPTHASDIA